MERARISETAWLGYTDWLRPTRVAAELGVDYKRVLRWLEREADPLPAVYIDGNRRERHINRKELNEWIERNSVAL